MLLRLTGRAPPDRWSSSFGLALCFAFLCFTKETPIGQLSETTPVAMSLSFWRWFSFSFFRVSSVLTQSLLLFVRLGPTRARYIQVQYSICESFL